MHSFHRWVSQYAGSLVHIVFNTNILYLHKSFLVKWWRMTEGARGMTEMLNKLSYKSLWYDKNKCDILLWKETVSYIYYLNEIYLIITYVYHSCLSVYYNIYFIYFNPSSSSFWRIVRHSFPNAAIPSRGAIIFRTGAGSFSFSLLFLQLDQEKESRRECEVVRVDRTEIHGGSRRGDDLPRYRSTCSWHQKPMLTTSNNSSKPSALSLSRLSKSQRLGIPHWQMYTRPPCVARYIKYVLAFDSGYSCSLTPGKLREENERE